MDDWNENNKLVQQRRERNLQKRAENSKNKLKNDIEKKIKTAMIGALASIEKYFGEHIGLNDDDVETNESELLTAWDNCRKEILDKGNKQIRIAKEEIDLYEVNYQGYQYNFDLRSEG